MLELHDAVDQGVYRVVGSEADITAGVPFGAALADDDVAGDDALAAVLLDAAVLRVAVAAVAGGADAFFMCHGVESSGDCDAGDADFGEALAMALLARVVLAALLLEYDDLVAAAVLDDLGGDRGAGEGGDTDVRPGTVVTEENVAERHLAPGSPGVTGYDMFCPVRHDTACRRYGL